MEGFDTKPLYWGLKKQEVKKLWPDVLIDDADTNYLNHRLGFVAEKYSNVYLRNFPGDCGALVMQNASNANEKALKEILEYTSKSGFSKIFATLVGELRHHKDAYRAFLNAGFRVVARGKSNRNDYKDDIVLVYYNRNCDYKGY